MKTTIKPISQQKSESNQHGTEISVWVLNESTVTVWLGALIEDDYVLYNPIKLLPDERGLLTIQSDAILAVEIEQFPPEDEALYLADEDSREPVIQIADATEEINYPIRIGIASEVFDRVIKDDYDVVILQENKYNI